MHLGEGFVREWLDRQHRNTSSLKALAKAKEETLCRKRSGYLRSAVENIRLCAFVRLPACQRRRGRSTVYRPNPGGSIVPRIEATTESPQQHGGSQDLLSTTVVSAYTNDALIGLALRKRRIRELRMGGPRQRPSLSLSDLRWFDR